MSTRSIVGLMAAVLVLAGLAGCQREEGLSSVDHALCGDIYALTTRATERANPIDPTVNPSHLFHQGTIVRVEDKGARIVDRKADLAASNLATAMNDNDVDETRKALDRLRDACGD